MNLQAISGRLLATVRRVAFQIVGSGTKRCGVVLGVAEHHVTIVAKQVAILSRRVAMIGTKLLATLRRVALFVVGFSRLRLPTDRTKFILGSEFGLIFGLGHADLLPSPEPLHSPVHPNFELGISLHTTNASLSPAAILALLAPPNAPSFAVFVAPSEAMERQGSFALCTAFEWFARVPKRRLIGSHDSFLAQGRVAVRAGECL